MIRTLAVALVMGAPLLIALGIMRMLRAQLELLIELGHSCLVNLRWASFLNRSQRSYR